MIYQLPGEVYRNFHHRTPQPYGHGSERRSRPLPGLSDSARRIPSSCGLVPIRFDAWTFLGISPNEVWGDCFRMRLPYSWDEGSPSLSPYKDINKVDYRASVWELCSSSAFAYISCPTVQPPSFHDDQNNGLQRKMTGVSISNNSLTLE